MKAAIEIPDYGQVQTTYKQFGEPSSAYPIGGVFANGWGCPPEATEGPAEVLAEQGFTVVTFEPDSTAKLTTEQRVHIMEAIGRNVLGDEYVAMGFSLGGDVASRVAYYDYESNESCVVGLVDAAGNHEEEDRFFTRIVAGMAETEFVGGGGLKRYLEALEKSDRKSVQDYAAHIAQMSREELAAYHFAAQDSMRNAEEGGSLFALLSYYGGPTYYIHGDGERHSYLYAIRAVGHIKEIEVPNAGHFMHTDAPEAYAGALAACLVEVDTKQLPVTQPRA